ncbi:predicted protein [Uncinocarpus reesii 1704]|uniref:LYC1 C-terminal domain-containing protein n=1 Tax=Uncinocarpus reesii (strain UAMH 1704) TaxID=336963 RepID=C4JDZ5_UNCRE|nr:uncharacterized protein UREG_00419 [Uncinocarpus reesii 1704]EEP75573.1 predicted protein [Uncinocarpus reesii 1704]
MAENAKLHIASSPASSQGTGNPDCSKLTDQSTPDDLALPDSKSPALHLSHPTDHENNLIWTLAAPLWKDALTDSQFLEECAHLTTVPLAANGGMTQWILVDRTLPPDHRPVLASCESIRKRSLLSDAAGNVTETITHGIASVFCNPQYRNRGYASRLLREVAQILPTWQVEDHKKVVGSVLFSGIGGAFYAALGWNPARSVEIQFSPMVVENPGASDILADQVGRLCSEDEAMIRRAMAVPAENGKARFMILPDHEHMLWHHRKEEFDCERLVGKKPAVKGAIAGQPGSRVWAIWMHRYCRSPGDEPSPNTLYILRLVIENKQGAPVEELKAVLQAAQTEAARWRLHHIKLWDPSPRVEQLVKQTGIQHEKMTRDVDGVCCLRWYGEGSGRDEALDWVSKEKYAWC